MKMMLGRSAKIAIALIVLVVLCGAVTAQENTPEGCYKKCHELCNSKSWVEAVKAYNNAIELDPQYSDAWSAKGLAKAALGMLKGSAELSSKALDATDRAIKMASTPQDQSYAWTQKGIALLGQNRYEEAVSAYDNAISADPKNLMALDTKGIILTRDLGRHSESINSFNKALQIYPNDVSALSFKGDALRGLGGYSEALRCYNRAIEIDSKVGRAWFGKGPCFKGAWPKL
ncbi:MAG TPA: tetratricopeptide repeat protein [Methanotrichaceae archaeon]|nr:tetratricopeptide repeat protein [Methanotrichaceae archaeon]